MAGVMMLLTTPILLCSIPEPPLKSEDGTGTAFVTSATSPFQTDSENITTARRNSLLIDGKTLSNCQENLKTFNSSLNSSHPDQWPGKVATSYDDSINDLSHLSQAKMPKKTSEHLETYPKDARATESGTEPHFSLVKHRQSSIFKKQNASLTLEEIIDNKTTGYLENYTEIPTSKLKDSLAESSLSLGQITSPSMLDDDLFLTFTCQGRCGKKISFPCSCSATCIIYGTCCDNMAQDCPHVWEEGLTRFDLIRTSDFICDQNSIFTITSCPKRKKEIVQRNEVESETSNKQMSMEESESLQIRDRFLSNIDTAEQKQNVDGDNTTSAIGPEKTRKDSITSQLLAALSAAPVTDSDTGLTFINKTIYNCNNMPKTKALYWAILLNYSFTSPTNLEDFVQHQMLNKYQPPFNKEKLTDHICIQNIQQTCNQTAGIEEPSGTYVKKCLESNNAVVFSYKPFLYYRNIFCAYCIEGRYIEYRLHLSNKVQLTSSPFQVLMTLTEDTFSLKKVDHGFEIFRVPWSQAKCPIHAQSSVEQVFNAGKSDQDSEFQCSVTCEDPNFTLRSDGMCKAPHGALLAIGDDGLTALCPEAMEGLAQFLACGLKQEIKNLKNADFSAPSVSVVFDSNLNRSLYVVRLHSALPQTTNWFFSYHTNDISENVYKLALLVKSFHHYRKSQNICQPREEDKKKTELKVIASSSLIKFGLDRKINIPQVMEELRGRIVDDENTTTVCLTKTVYCFKECPTKVLNPNQLLCMDDPVHERDSAWISKFRSSSCFYHLNKLKTQAKNRVTTFRQDSESLLQYVLSLNFLGVTILLSF
ncbi:hypothetical protein PoB_002545300 [Plakobranchus ocellatus]|uniref:SMB domain-containing protein n=1 Tax=Plakobranchus ocellatus TaxID=259542 RepID=A0AAV3ZX15_9GAST|nr:hypothetical protein PoB_002545300 [Plakobranchus ocellatus]